jgi:hypothetical protein
MQEIRQDETNELEEKGGEEVGGEDEYASGR